MSRQWVKDMQVGQDVSGTYAVSSVQLRSYTNGDFLALRLSDRTGKVSAVYWRADADLYAQVANASLVQIKGKVGTYQGQLQVNISSLTCLSSDEGIDASEFLPVGTQPPEQLVEQLKQWKDSLKAAHYRQLWELFFEDRDFFRGFTLAPAGKQWHHPFVGGLLEHTVSLIALCDRILSLYPSLNRDLLLSGALFHDIGKVEELSCRATIDYTDEGRLIGHIVLGAQRVRDYARQIPEFPEEDSMLLQHLILSHQGETPESPRIPRCRESLVLHLADMMDSQLAAYSREMDKVGASERRWTRFVKLIGRHLYRGEPEAPAEEAQDES